MANYIPDRWEGVDFGPPPVVIPVARPARRRGRNPSEHQLPRQRIYYQLENGLVVPADSPRQRASSTSAARPAIVIENNINEEIFNGRPVSSHGPVGLRHDDRFLEYEAERRRQEERRIADERRRLEEQRLLEERRLLEQRRRLLDEQLLVDERDRLVVDDRRLVRASSRHQQRTPSPYDRYDLELELEEKRKSKENMEKMDLETLERMKRLSDFERKEAEAKAVRIAALEKLEKKDREEREQRRAELERLEQEEEAKRERRRIEEELWAKRAKEEAIAAARKKEDKELEQRVIAKYKKEQEEAELKREREKQKERERVEEETRKMLAKAGYSEKEIDKVIRKAEKGDKYTEEKQKGGKHKVMSLSRPTWIKVHTKHMATETLDIYGLEWDYAEVSTYTSTWKLPKIG